MTLQVSLSERLDWWVLSSDPSVASLCVRPLVVQLYETAGVCFLLVCFGPRGQVK